MNSLERKMVDALKNLRCKYAVNGIKAEFKAAGIRLKDMYLFLGRDKLLINLLIPPVEYSMLQII